MLIYLDNSATTWPKPVSVLNAMNQYLKYYGGSPGRSGHQLALKASREVYETRELIAQMFNVVSSDKVIFTSNATHALNIAIKGVLKANDHVVISSMEHNSVIRPLRYLEKSINIQLSIIQCNKEGELDPELLKKSICKNTKLVITLHGSNVCGSLMPIREIGKICKSCGVLYLVDAAQTAGFLPIDMKQDNIDLLAFTGHKKLYGPPGIGGLCINNDIPIEKFIQGGTGSSSESEEHPDFYPDRLEAGTLNTLGIIGLKAGIKYLLKTGMDNIREKQNELAALFLNELNKIDECKIYGPPSDKRRLPLIAADFKNHSISEIAHQLDKKYGILTRVGLQCSPLAHKTLGTFPNGTIRFSLGAFNTKKEIMHTISALKRCLQ